MTTLPVTEVEVVGPFAKAVAKEIRARIDDISVAKLVLIAHDMEMTIPEFWDLISGNVDITANQIDWLADLLGVATPYEIVAAAEGHCKPAGVSK